MNADNKNSKINQLPLIKEQGMGHTGKAENI
jgi:hypothetical protein